MAKLALNFACNRFLRERKVIIMEKIMDELIENLRRQKEQQLLDDIIDIYNHKYKDYGEYKKAIQKRINPDIGFTPILSIDTFYYIKNKRE